MSQVQLQTDFPRAHHGNVKTCVVTGKQTNKQKQNKTTTTKTKTIQGQDFGVKYKTKFNV